MGRKSRTKGKVGEREWAHFLSARGFASRRGQQFSGSPDSPDVVTDCLPGVHWECKRCEAGNPYDWLAQAHADAAGKLPIVAHRRNDCRWLCIMDAETLCEIIRRSELVRQDTQKDANAHADLSAASADKVRRVVGSLNNGGVK